MENEKAILHAKRCDFSMDNKNDLIKGEYSVEVSGSHGKKAIW